MLKRKAGTSDKKRKHSLAEDRRDHCERRAAESSVEMNSKEELADPELDRIGSDIEDGGLDLSLPFQPITAYVADKREMLKQCFHVLGEKKLHKMLPDELKDCSVEEIKRLCWEQLEPISQINLMHILAGEELISERTEEPLPSGQDNIVDSTTYLQENENTEVPKPEAGVSLEESDVLSINADTYDSDIEGAKEEQTGKAADRAVKLGQSGGDPADPQSTPDPPAPAEPPAATAPSKAKKDIQSDIDKSVSEILSPSDASRDEVAPASSAPPPPPVEVSLPDPGRPASSCAPAAPQPSIQQLELLELEMRARAIKALMKAGDGKKAPVAKNP